MDLVRLIYASRAKDDFCEDDIASILHKARANNARMDVTGILLFSCNYFVQCLEGRRDVVDELYDRIINDERHYGVELLLNTEATAREFADWRMGYVGSTQFNRAIWMQFMPSPEFNPLEMHGESCLEMLLSLRSHLRTIGTRRRSLRMLRLTSIA